MMTTDNGCLEYTAMSVDLFFEPEHVACQYCPLLETYARNQCRRTGEYIIDPRFTVGRFCPLYPQNTKEKETAKNELDIE